MRLKLMATVNFQRSEADNLNAVLKRHPDMVLGPNDVVLMISMDKSQMVFMFRKDTIDVSEYGKRRGEADVYNSRRVRLSRSTWDWRMLQEYATKANIELDGIQPFEKHFPKLRHDDNTVNLNAKGARKMKPAKGAKVIDIRKKAAA